MKMKIIISIILICCLMTFCNKKNSKKDSAETVDGVSPSTSYFKDFNDLDKMKMLSQKVKNGDTVSYKELRYIYFYSGHTHDFLYNAINMAEKHNYPMAYYDVYTILRERDSTSNINKVANYYLFAAYERNAEHSKSTIIEMFGHSYTIPKSEDYWNEIK